MKQNHFMCSTPRSAYNPVRFQDSLRKYQRIPTKKIKCCSIVNKCKHCCQKNHNIQQQQRITRINSCRKLYSNLHKLDRKRQKFLIVSQFDENALIKKQLFKDQLETQLVKYPSDNNQGMVGVLVQMSKCLKYIANEILPVQQYKKAQIAKDSFQTTEDDMTFNYKVNDNDQLFNLVTLNTLSNSTKYQLENVKRQQMEEQQPQYIKIENEMHSAIIEQAQNQVFPKISAQFYTNKQTAQNVNKQNYQIIPSNVSADNLIDKTSEKVTLLQSYHKQQKPISHQFTPQKPKRKLAKKLQQATPVKVNSHFKIKVGKSQCIISIRIFDKAIKSLADADDMVQSLIQQRPYLKPVKTELQKLIKSHLQSL